MTNLAALSEQLLVKRVIGLDGMTPEKSGRHCTAAHGTEQLRMLMNRQGPLHRLAVAGDIGLVEQEAGDTILDGVGQTTRAPRDGKGGITLGVHLAKTARLVARRHQQDIDEEIKTYLEKWSIDRLAAVDRNLLRLAIYELKHCSDEVPVNVVLDEAIEIAKLYGDDQSSRFINGVLSKVKQSIS